MEPDLRQNLIPLLRKLAVENPQNVKLGFLFADHLLEFGYLDEAENQLRKLERENSNYLSKAGIARIHFLRNEFKICKTLTKELIDSGYSDLNLMLLYAKALFNEGLVEEAHLIFVKILNDNPQLGPEEKLIN